MDIYKKLPTDLQKIIDKMIFQMNYSEMIDDLKNGIIFHYWCDYCIKRKIGVYCCHERNVYRTACLYYCNDCIEDVRKIKHLNIYDYYEYFKIIKSVKIQYCRFMEHQ